MRDDRKLDIPFKTLERVISTAQLGSFRKAARLSGVNPSVIVRAINHLEKEIGVKLFSRTQHRLFVTEAGAAFVREIVKAVTHVERAYDLSQCLAQIDQGPLRLGYSSSAISRLIPILVKLEIKTEAMRQTSNSDAHGASSKEYVTPSKVLLESGTTVELIDRVHRGRLHAAFGVTPIADVELSVHPVAREPFSLSVSKNHRLAKQPSISAKDLDGETVFLFPKAAHPLLHERMLDYIESTGAKLQVREAMSLAQSMEIVSHNLGVALLPRSVSRFSYLGVLFKPVADRLLWIETALFYVRHRRDNRLSRLLDDVISQSRQFGQGV